MPKKLREDQILERYHIGTITTEETEEEIEIYVHGTQSFPILEFNDGSVIYWTWEDLLNQADEVRENEKRKNV